MNIVETPETPDRSDLVAIAEEMLTRAIRRGEPWAICASINGLKSLDSAPVLLDAIERRRICPMRYRGS